MMKKLAQSHIVRMTIPLVLFCLITLPASGAEEKTDAETTTLKLARITVKGSLQDALPQENPFGPRPMYFKKLLNLIHKAAKDKNVAALLLKVNSPSIGFCKVHELNNAIKGFKDSGKKIFGYSETLSSKEMMILSQCDYLAVPESGMIVMPGLNIEVMYFKKLFEKLGIKFLVKHIGDYKSAFEDFSRNSMSEELREVLNCLLDEFYSNIISTIAKNRNIDELKVAQAIDDAIITPEKALEYGLIDKVCYRCEFDDHIKNILKAEKIKIEKKYGREDKDLDLENPLVLFAQVMSTFSGKKKKESANPKIALIYASGMIHSGKNQVDPFSGEVTIGSETLAKAIDDAAENETVKAIVLRINSPGGSGLASDIIWKAEMKAKAKKPFIVSMADVAGSGGYYIAMAADMILAEPSTITGSIGVVAAIPNIHKTLNKLGIKTERLSRGKNASIDSITTPPKDFNMKIIGDVMEEFYWKFVDKVAAGRKMTREDIHKIAQGRVWTGRQALDNGLVDALGGLEDAIQIAKVKAGLTDNMDWELKEMPEAPDFFESLSENFDMKMALRALVQASGLNPMESMLLDHRDIKACLSRLGYILNISRTEPILFLMPMDIQVNF